MTFINCTPHLLNIHLRGGEILALPASGILPRVRTEEDGRTIDIIDGIRVAGPAEYQGVEGLPEPQEGVFYIVSGVVGSHVEGRDDVLVPGTSDLDLPVRDERRQIVGVTQLNRAGGNPKVRELDAELTRVNRLRMAMRQEHLKELGDLEFQVSEARLQRDQARKNYQDLASSLQILPAGSDTTLGMEAKIKELELKLEAAHVKLEAARVMKSFGQ